LIDINGEIFPSTIIRLPSCQEVNMNPDKQRKEWKKEFKKE